MAGGIDNGTLQGGLFAQTKQFGAILRGFGPPAPQAGSLGDAYIDTQTWFLYGRTEQQGTYPWSQFYTVPAAYQGALKWFAAAQPDNTIGVDGDYCLLWGFGNYGLQPSIFGPKVNGCWPESGDGPTTVLDPAYAGFTLPAGLSDEGNPTAYSPSTQLIASGLADEYILAIPIAQLPSSPVYELGLGSTPVNIAVPLNPTYNAANEHPV